MNLRRNPRYLIACLLLLLAPAAGAGHDERQVSHWVRHGHGDADYYTPRPDRNSHSYTSEPVRGGSSRRTRIIANPYSQRLVTGITLTGIDDAVVHIKDVIAYPYRERLSPLGYTLSGYLPQRYIRTGHFVEYISVAAKRKAYFVVTFHYD